MKILQINTVAVHGSTGRITEGIGEEIVKRGGQSYIAYGRHQPSGSQFELIQIGGKADVWNHVLQTRLFDRHGLGSKQATNQFILTIEQLRPDIIHLHNIHGYYLNIEILFEYLKRVRIPVVWTFHDCWPMTGHCTYFTAVKCDKWMSQCHNCPRLHGYPQSLFWDGSRRNHSLKRELFTSVDRMVVVPVSAWLGSVAERSFFQKYPIRPIQNGIDIETFAPRSASRLKEIRRKYDFGDKFVILGVATPWSDEKGLSDFIELRKHLDTDCVIVLVGVTPQQMKRLPAGIIGIERTDNAAELADLYACADLFVNGSFEETFGLVTAEAMSCGTPVVVYDATACPEIVTPQTGFVIPVKNIGAMCATISAYQKIGKKAYSRNCRDYTQTHLDKRVKYAEYVDLYEQIMNNEI